MHAAQSSCLLSISFSYTVICCLKLDKVISSYVKRISDAIYHFFFGCTGSFVGLPFELWICTQCILPGNCFTLWRLLYFYWPSFVFPFTYFWTVGWCMDWETQSYSDWYRLVFSIMDYDRNFEFGTSYSVTMILG